MNSKTNMVRNCLTPINASRNSDSFLSCRAYGVYHKELEKFIV